MPRMWSRVTPYLTARMPPAQVAALPPTVENFTLAGSGAKKSCLGARAVCKSPVTTPGSTSATKSSPSMSRIRFSLAVDTTMPPVTGTQSPTVLVARPRGRMGTRSA